MLWATETNLSTGVAFSRINSSKARGGSWLGRTWICQDSWCIVAFGWRLGVDHVAIVRFATGVITVEAAVCDNFPFEKRNYFN